MKSEPSRPLSAELGSVVIGTLSSTTEIIHLVFQTMHPTVSVAVRVRPAEPANETEEWIIQENVIYGVRPENQRKVFAFDHIISQTGTNAEVYDRVVYPILNSVIAGYNGTVLAYGQTCPGKRHMTDKDGDPSVIRRAIIGIFDEIDKVREKCPLSSPAFH